MPTNSNNTTPGPASTGNGGNNNSAGGNNNNNESDKSKTKNKNDTNKENKPKEAVNLYRGMCKIPLFAKDNIVIDVGNRFTAVTKMIETLRSHSSAEGHADWNPRLKNDELLTLATYWDRPYNPPVPVDENAPTWQERNAVDIYSKSWLAEKNLYQKKFLDNEEWGKSLYDIVELQTSPAVWNDVEAHNDFTNFSQNRCVIRLLRALRVICQRGITGQKNDIIVDSIETNRRTLNYRQPGNKEVATFVEGLKESVETALEVGGKLPFGTAALEEAIDENVGNGMTISQYFDPNINDAVALANRAALDEAYKRKILSRLLILNCKYKSVKEDIQFQQTHARPDANGIIASRWPNNLSSALSMVMLQEQKSKQNSGGGGSPTKRNRNRRNRGGGNNNSNSANVSLTNAEDAEPEGASRDGRDTDAATDAPAPSNNNTQVRFVMSAIGDEFDQSVDDDIIWETDEDNDPSSAAVRITKANLVEDGVPEDNQNNDSFEGSDTVRRQLQSNLGEYWNIQPNDEDVDDDEASDSNANNEASENGEEYDPSLDPVLMRKAIFRASMMKDGLSVAQREDHAVAVETKLMESHIINGGQYEDILDRGMDDLDRHLTYSGNLPITKATANNIRLMINDPATKDIELMSIMADEELMTITGSEEKSDLQHLLLVCAKYQQRLRPNKWTNDVMKKFEKSGINNLYTLFMLLKSNSLNARMKASGLSTFHHPTMKMMSCAQDYVQVMENRTLLEDVQRDDYAGYPMGDEYSRDEDFQEGGR